MKYDRRIILSIFWIAAGLVLMGCNWAGLVEEFWSSMGFALIIVGAIQTVRNIKYKTNAEYREQVDIASKDERNRFIANKAWAWAGYLFVMIAAVASIGFRIAGLDELSILASGSVCLIIVLYWISYMILRRKY